MTTPSEIAAAHPVPQPWTADTGDGNYRNPVLFADWSDPDVIRHGDDYWMTTSSFNRVPGLPVLHSTDLVNWRIAGHALHRLPDEYAVPRPGCGVWAPAIRFHDGRFWICYPDPDHGIFLTTATDPAGPWTEPILILPGRGRIDPCPLWDDDGNVYLVHAWARSRCGFNNRLTAVRMSADLTRALDDGRTIVDGDAVDGMHTLEGPKWYKHDGWYWIFAPGGGVTGGWQYAMRSRHVLGPYEPRIVLARGATDVNGPHQGAWVRTPSGDSWFLHFQDRGAYGRVVHLQPMTWDTGGWPVLGDGGQPVRSHRKPAGRPSAVREPVCDDDFPGGRPGPQWSWPANPRPGVLSGHPGDGLRFGCRPASSADLRAVPTVLGQRLPGPPMRAEVTLSLDAGSGARAGLVVLGRTYCWIGLRRRAHDTVLVCRAAGTASDDAALPDAAHYDPAAHPVREQDVLDPVVVPAGIVVRLSVTVEAAVARFGAEFGAGHRVVSPPFAVTPGVWTGATLGVFATGPDGHADFGSFTVRRV